MRRRSDGSTRPPFGSTKRVSAQVSRRSFVLLGEPSPEGALPASLALRARVTDGEPDDSTVKLRPVRLPDRG
jgi:hypothetical protein